MWMGNVRDLHLPKWNKWLYLGNLLVLKKFRRAGVGTALIESSMELAKSVKKYIDSSKKKAGENPS